MNLLEIRTDSRRMLREITAAKSAHTDADLNKFINDGIKDMCIKAFVLITTDTFTVTTTVASYALSYDHIKTISLLNSSGVPLIQILPTDARLMYLITGKPLYFYETQTRATLVTRANGTIYTAQQLLLPASLNGYMYEVTTGGTTGGAPPVYSTSPGTAQSDGIATITCRELITYLYMITLVDTPTTAGAGTGTYTIIHNMIDEGLYTDTDAPNFPWEKHHLLVDYTCWRALSANRQFKDSLPFITNYAKGLGLKIENYIGGGEAK